jgi:2-amino-4-hydroxy-6-hydroxymethyldihydropteridine diphosphokinase
MRVYLALGSNLGDRIVHLRRAVEELRILDPELQISQAYATSPVGGPPQGEYLNCVVGLETDLPPLELLALAQRLENEAGRVRSVVNGPRTLDVDILLIDAIEVSTPELTVPHPRMWQRGFVLAPLEELDPGLVPPDWRTKIPRSTSLAVDVRPVGTI